MANKASLAAATRVTRLDSHAYRVDLDDAFCIGNGNARTVIMPLT